MKSTRGSTSDTADLQAVASLAAPLLRNDSNLIPDPLACTNRIGLQR